MRKKILLSFLVLILGKQKTIAQNEEVSPLANSDNNTTGNKGRVFFYWGWNTAQYSNSNIHFYGNNYDFTIHNAQAGDRITKPITFREYLHPTNLTIPQTNARLGYYFHDHWSVSIGLDHMKYVMRLFGNATISGEINLTDQDEGVPYFNGNYDHSDIALLKTFVEFEHTDGLNYVTAEIGRIDNLGAYINLNPKKIQINLIEGFSAGVVIPKTNATILGKERHDAFHLAGYGISLKGGINITFFNSFFIQTEIKGGFINLPDIRTTNSTSDKATQNFFFFQQNVTLGGTFKIF
ncbi:hypothetical protein [Aquimarina pacifica]|uniref:hypothetical protein n=1 Tax=Aquimarina pacifica TaxID=1296415 RepID=UPI00047203C9|nr:hypothetical protein [Aquimarina pacifica]